MQLPEFDIFVWWGDGIEPYIVDKFPTIFVGEGHNDKQPLLYLPPESFLLLFKVQFRLWSGLVDSSAFFLRKYRNMGKSVPFRHRKPVVVWRGSPTGCFDVPHVHYCKGCRFILVNTSVKYPHVLDARFSSANKIQGIKEMNLDLIGPSLNDEDHLQYKFIASCDGNSVANRLPRQMALGSVLLKGTSKEREFWYRDLVPWKHYIPFEGESDLKRILKDIHSCFNSKSSRSDDECARRYENISKAGTTFIEEQFTVRRMECFFIASMHLYNSLFWTNSAVQPRPVEITQAHGVSWSFWMYSIGFWVLPLVGCASLWFGALLRWYVCAPPMRPKPRKHEHVKLG